MRKLLCINTIGIAALTLLGMGCREQVVEQSAPPPAVAQTPAAAAASSGEVVVDNEPPPPQVETIPASPDPTFVWVGGAWEWDSGRWGWHAGRYERPPHPGAVWAPHRVENRNGHHVFVRGGWR